MLLRGSHKKTDNYFQRTNNIGFVKKKLKKNLFPLTI